MNADQRRAPTPDGGSRSPGHGPKIRPVDDRTLGLRVRVSEIAQLMNSLRQTHAGGRPARPTPCSRCGAPCPSARYARTLSPQGCPRQPRADESGWFPGSDTSDDQRCHSIELPAEESASEGFDGRPRNELPPSGSRWRSSTQTDAMPALRGRAPLRVRGT